MSIKVVDRSVKFQNIDVEYAEDKLGSGKKVNFLLSKDDIEELHVGLGDDIFFKFITNMEIITDTEGKDYYRSFLSDYEVPEPEEKTTNEEEFTNNPINYLDEAIYRYRRNSRNRGKQPKYFIFSRKTMEILQDHFYQRAVRDPQYLGFSPHSRNPWEELKELHYSGIPIAIIEDREKFLVDVV